MNTVFNEEFFKSEIRCDFEISSEMKHCWAAEIELLGFVQRICEDYGLKYYAAYGTLLGAVRHGGYIPWDDDIDIFMMREDYETLLRVLPDEIPPFMRFNSCRVSGYNGSIPNVANGRDLPQSPEVIEIFHGCPYVVGIDIFVLDYIPRDKENRESQSLLAGFILHVFFNYEEFQEKGQLEEKLSEVEEFCNIKIDRSGDVRHQLLLIYDRVISLYNEEESDKVTFFQGYVGSSLDSVFDKEWFGEGKLVPFENTVINIPADSDSLLKVMFGDYKVPIRNVSDHDYPIYRHQKEFLEKLHREEGK